ncbi:hypothetical protein FB45DRAFT_894237 [Roridomyces roridus]|uniref:Uncharacterized protein n=1 Tax=Roridomyces roridus TaxID=1738132 RepID=A0AAD7CI15_9AGAR|nr:hypothetical protein FB45DRAFT_894237 [Roridomyces roridus]
MTLWILKTASTRAFHTTTSWQSQYRGPHIHGTLREWALRMIEKDVSKWNRRKMRVPSDVVKLMGEADAIVQSVQRRDAQRNYTPRGPSLRLVQAADRLLQHGPTTEADRWRRLREALRLYYRASERANGTMPVIGSRIWGTTMLLEHRIRKTSEKLHKAEMRSFANPPVAHNEVGWGLHVKQPDPPEVLTIQQPPTQDQLQMPSKAGVQYKTAPCPPMPRIPPSAVERARMPLLQAFPGVGTVGGTQLGVNHALWSASGFLGTDTSSTSLSSRAIPAPHSPPTTAQGGNLKWTKHRERNERLAKQYFVRAAAPVAPPPLSPSFSLSSLPTSLSELPTPIPTLDDSALEDHLTSAPVNPVPEARQGRRTPYVSRKPEMRVIRFPQHHAR